MPDNRTTQRLPRRDINAAERAATAIKLRAAKMTYDQVAKSCGYSDRSAARHAVQREMDRVVVTNVEQLRKEELLLLDTMQQEVYALFMDRKNTYRLYAADRLLAISERRSRLMGLDIPIDAAMNTNITVIREIPQGLFGVVEAPTNA